jgi:membrane protein DedA with SNARE-associated domain
MFESIFNSLQTFNPLLIYLFLLIIPFVENIFPPAPADLMVVFCASLIVNGTIQLAPTLILTSIGSELGFLFLFYIGTQTDRKLVNAGKVKFVSIESLQQVEKWFTKFGFFVILLNRFLPGIRSIVSFFAGLSELPFKKTLVLSSVSAVLWNVVLITLGILFGNNLDAIDRGLRTYTTIIVIIAVLIVSFYIIKYFLKKKAKN